MNTQELDALQQMLEREFADIRKGLLKIWMDGMADAKPEPVAMMEPATVMLTEDCGHQGHLADLGVFFAKGTVLHRQITGQYTPEGTALGRPCVSHYDAIRDISVPVG
jgi:hypothetical protein